MSEIRTISLGDSAQIRDWERIDKYLNWLASLGRKPRSVDSIRKSVVAFAQYLWTGKKHLLCAEPRDVEEYLGSLQEVISDKTRFNELTAIRGFFDYALTHHWIQHDPTVFSRVRQSKTKDKRYLSQEAAVEMLDAALAKAQNPNASPFDIRNWAMLDLCYGSLIRAAELAGLELDRIHLDEGLLLVHGKGDKDRMVPITDAAKDALKIYLSSARGYFLAKYQGSEPNNVLFLSKSGNPMDHSSVWDVVNQAHPEASPHVLRRSGATHQVKNGASLGDVQLELGHELRSTTFGYLESVKFEELEREHRRCHVRAQKTISSGND